MNIQIYYTLAQEGGGGEWRIQPTEEKTFTKHTGSKKGFENKTERYAEKLQIHNIHYIQTRGFAGAVTVATVTVKRRAQRSPSIVHAVAVRI